MASARVTVIAEVPERSSSETWWTLHFQKVVYNYDNKTHEKGYRFIWRREDGSLQAARGQARIPSKTEMMEFIEMAERAGLFLDED